MQALFMCKPPGRGAVGQLHMWAARPGGAQCAKGVFHPGHQVCPLNQGMKDSLWFNFWSSLKNMVHINSRLLSSQIFPHFKTIIMQACASSIPRGNNTVFNITVFNVPRKDVLCSRPFTGLYL
jgi:hypothetical protein